MRRAGRVAAPSQRRRYTACWPGPPHHRAAWSFTRRVGVRFRPCRHQSRSERTLAPGGAAASIGDGSGRWESKEPHARHNVSPAYSPDRAPWGADQARGMADLAQDGRNQRSGDEVAGEPPLLKDSGTRLQEMEAQDPASKDVDPGAGALAGLQSNIRSSITQPREANNGEMASAAAWEGPAAAELKAAGAEAIPGGVRVKGWVIRSHKGPILNAASLQRFEDELQTTHLPEMVFGESFLSLEHTQTGIRLHFNALDALKAWKKEALPPVEVPAAAKWKFRSKPSDQVILDYDYTFTTPYCGSDVTALNSGTVWTYSQLNLLNLTFYKENIICPLPLFTGVVILYEDELADNGISFLTVRVRVMPTGWFLLLRFWLRVDGVLMRLRDTRLHCPFGNGDGAKPVVLRECCWREATFASLSAKGYPSDSAAYADPNLIAQKLPVVMQKIQKLKIPN
nr:unnamed protein product [Digitaria exilis]